MYRRQKSFNRRQILGYNSTNTKPPKTKTNHTTSRKQNIFERNTTQRTINTHPAPLNSKQRIYGVLVEREEKSQFEELDIDITKLQSLKKQSDFRLQASKAAQNQTNAIPVEEDIYTFNPLDEIRIPVIIQCMPIKNDTETFERLNDKLKNSLADAHLIGNCDYVDFKFVVAPELSIRVVERQCNNRQKGIICYGFLKNKKILNGVECGLDDEVLADKDSKYPFIANIVNFKLYSRRFMTNACNNAVRRGKKNMQVLYESDSDDENNKNSEISTTQEPNQEKSLNNTQSNQPEERIITPIEKAIENARLNGISEHIQYTEKMSIIIGENEFIQYKFNSNQTHLNTTTDIENPYCLLTSVCNCSIKSINTRFTLQSNPLDETITFKNKIPTCKTEANCNCYAKNTIVEFNVITKLENLDHEALLKCSNAMNADPISQYNASMSQNYYCPFEFKEGVHQSSMKTSYAYLKLINPLIFSIRVIRDYFVKLLL
ncbi:hypothetical protein COBT_001436 [Conglomerata obtusa]